MTPGRSMDSGIAGTGEDGGPAGDELLGEAAAEAAIGAGDENGAASELHDFSS